MFRSIRRKIRQFLDLVNNADAALAANVPGKLAGLSLAHYRDWLLLTRPHYRDPRCLVPYGYGVYSQTDEDGILAEVFRRLNITGGTFVEFGVEDGTETNTTALLQADWSGVWLEGSATHCARIRELFAGRIAAGRLTLRKAFATAENIDKLFVECSVPAEPELLVIDVDGNDYWLWKALDAYRPKIAVIEYNADFGPSLEWIMPYNPEHRFGGTRYAGASLKALEQLGRQKGYRLVGCNWFGMNAFFVRDDLEGNKFLAPFTSETHFEPPRHHWRSGGAWPKDDREFYLNVANLTDPSQ